METSNKISTEFSTRLNRLNPDQVIRSIVMLQTPLENDKFPSQRQRTQRIRTFEPFESSSEEALNKIETILNKYGGKKLSNQPNALGCIHIETTPAGIKALAELEEIKTIMEDQPISLIH